MMSLRQRHIDPQLAIGSQRLVETCLLAGQQGEGNPHPPRSRATLRQSRSQSFGQLECLPLPPLSSAVSQPSIVCSSNLNPQSLSSLSSSSSCLPSSVGGAVAPHSSHTHHAYFQPMDPIPDFTFSDVSKAHSSRSDSFGYPFSFQFSTHIACACFFCCFFKPFHFLTQASECRCLLLYIIVFPFILFCHHAFYSFHHSFGFHVIAADEALVHTYRCFAKHFPSEVYPCGHVKWSVVYQLHQCTVNPLLALLGLFTSLELKLRLRNKLIPHPQNVVLWCLSYVDVDLIIFAFWYVQNCIW